MSEYRTPEEDTIGRRDRDDEEPAEQAGPAPESGEKPEHEDRLDAGGRTRTSNEPGLNGT